MLLQILGLKTLQCKEHILIAKNEENMPMSDFQVHCAAKTLRVKGSSTEVLGFNSNLLQRP